MSHNNLSRRRHQYAVYWEATRFDSFGEVTVSSPREISVRIEKGLFETLDPQGNKISFDVKLGVPETLVNGSFIWLGKLADLPNPVPELLQVIGYEEIPNVKGRKFDRWVSLMKHSSKNPVLT